MGFRERRAARDMDDDRRVYQALRFSTPASRYELWTRTGLRSPRIARALARLARTGLVTSDVDAASDRTLYRTTTTNGARP